MSFFNETHHRPNTSEQQKLLDKNRRYRAFRYDWARAVTNERAKSKIVPCDEYVQNDHGVWMWSKGTGKCRKKGWLEASHHILFNIIMERNLDTGFSPITALRKMPSVYTPWQHFNEAIDRVVLMCERAKKFTTEPVKTKWDYYHLKEVMDWLEPISGSVTLYHLANRVDVNKLKMIKRFIEKKF